MQQLNHCEIISKVKQFGAFNASIINTSNISFEPEFRKMCESNSCGMYGKCWTCPPHVGDINTLIKQAKSYNYALVYQTVDTLEDSYDFEGMQKAGQKINKLTRKIQNEHIFQGDCLHLGAGGCRVCKTCSKKNNEPCRFPDKAISSLEAYGINVSLLANACGMNYINGINTVTYFGAVFFN